MQPTSVWIVVLLELCYWRTLGVQGLIISLNGQSIANNKSRISVYNFDVVDGDDDFSSALRCQSQLTTANVKATTNGCLVGDGDGPITCVYPLPHRINTSGEPERGWIASRVNNENGRRVLYLTRRTQNPEEGYYNCHMSGDTNPLSGLYILYPITAVSAAIEVEEGTSTFRVRCTSTGGRALNMAVTGPNGYSSDLTSTMQADSSREFIGNDSYTATTEVILSGRDGDVYECNVTSVESKTKRVTVEAAAAPTLKSLQQTDPTTVRVMWTTSPEASVTGYRVLYSSPGESQTLTDVINSTSRDITGLTNGKTYTFSVEVITSNKLPGLSEVMTITMGPSTPEGVVAAAESASIRVSWQAVDDADSYIVTFSQTDQCPTDSHTPSLTLNAPYTTVNVAVGRDVELTATDMLRAYTAYEVTVEAVSNVTGGSPPSVSKSVVTPQTGAGEAPGDVRAEAESSTSISVQWSGLSNCRLVNGRIIGYKVRLVTCCTAETRVQELGDGEDWSSGGEILLSGLAPFTNYSISVAAVNENGDIGLYSDPVTTLSHQFSCSIETGSMRSSSSTGVIVGVVMGLISLALGISGLIGGFVIARRYHTAHSCRPEAKGSERNISTEQNPVYDGSCSHKTPKETKEYYEPQTEEGVYEGVLTLNY